MNIEDFLPQFLRPSQSQMTLPNSSKKLLPVYEEDNSASNFLEEMLMQGSLN